MMDGFVKVAAGTPDIRVADCSYNAEQCAGLMRNIRLKKSARSCVI